MARHAGGTNHAVEGLIVEGDPVAEGLEHPLRHIGGGGLGKGDAEDFLRGHAVKQQPDDALHQHMGLAGSGVGGDESRRRGIGGAGLRGADAIGNRADRRHSPPPAPPAADHSLIRARSS